MPKRREVPPRPDAAVKLNTAAVLREDALYKAKQQKEAKQIAAYEAELRDCTEFYMWQTDMREKDLAIRREQVGRSRASPPLRKRRTAPSRVEAPRHQEGAGRSILSPPNSSSRP